MSKDRKQINIRVSDDILQMIGDLQRADKSALTAPTVTDVVVAAIERAHAQLPKDAKRR